MKRIIILAILLILVVYGCAFKESKDFGIVELVQYSNDLGSNRVYVTTTKGVVLLYCKIVAIPKGAKAEIVSSGCWSKTLIINEKRYIIREYKYY